MIKKKEELIEHLKKFVLCERRKLFKNKINQRTKHITIVLENIFQGRNISASIRSADCFGIQDVHVIENNNIFNEDKEVSIGSEKWITIKRYNKKEKNTLDTIKELKNNGYKIIATTPQKGDCNLYDLDISDKTALFFGSEFKGCSKELLKVADKRMNIPMYGFTESFNISVAVSLCLQHLTFKMRKSKVDWKLKEKAKQEVMLKWLRNSIKSSKEIERSFFKT